MLRKISFPIMRAPMSYGGNECAIYVSQPIPHAYKDHPEQCFVVGTDLVTGQPIKWNVSIADFQSAVRSAVTFVETDALRAPTGILGPGNLPRSSV